MSNLSINSCLRKYFYCFFNGTADSIWDRTAAASLASLSLKAQLIKRFGQMSSWAGEGWYLAVRRVLMFVCCKRINIWKSAARSLPVEGGQIFFDPYSLVWSQIKLLPGGEGEINNSTKYGGERATLPGESLVHLPLETRSSESSPTNPAAPRVSISLPFLAPLMPWSASGLWSRLCAFECGNLRPQSVFCDPAHPQFSLCPCVLFWPPPPPARATLSSPSPFLPSPFSSSSSTPPPPPRPGWG